MKFDIKKGSDINIHKYPTEDFTIASSFAKRLKTEFQDFLVTCVLFGSSARGKKKSNDIDVLIVVDDLSIRMTQDVIEAYKLIVERTIGKISTKLHVTSMTLTSFWEYLREGDPVAINILRDGVSLVDCNFFKPFQALLIQGRIKPTKESVWSYFGRAPRTIVNSRWHIMQATLDLYWAVIDSAHAALMFIGEIPPSPEHVADLMRDKLVNNHGLEQKYVATMRKFYRLMKNITHREIKSVSGEEFEKYRKEAEAFIKRMRKFIED